MQDDQRSANSGPEETFGSPTHQPKVDMIKDQHAASTSGNGCRPSSGQGQMPPPEKRDSNASDTASATVEEASSPAQPAPDSTPQQRQLSFSSMEEALGRPRTALTKVPGDDYDAVKRNEQDWVWKIKAALNTAYKTKPDATIQNKKGTRSEEEVLSRWLKWQEEASKRVDKKVKGGDLGDERERAAWFLLKEVLDLHQYGFLTGTKPVQQSLTCSARLDLIISVIAGYTVIRSDVVLRDRCHQLVADPGHHAEKKLESFWSNMSKAEARLAASQALSQSGERQGCDRSLSTVEGAEHAGESEAASPIAESLPTPQQAAHDKRPSGGERGVQRRSTGFTELMDITEEEQTKIIKEEQEDEDDDV